MLLYASSQCCTVSSVGWLCCSSGSKLNAFGSVSALSLTPFQLQATVFSENLSSSQCTQPQSTEYIPLGLLPVSANHRLLFKKEAISGCCNAERFRWKTTCPPCPGGESWEVRTDVGTVRDGVLAENTIFVVTKQGNSHKVVCSTLFNSPYSKEKPIYIKKIELSVIQRLLWLNKAMFKLMKYTE